VNKLFHLLENEPKWLYLFCFLLAIPAFFINLGLMPILADEPTRAIVAMEMMFSENYWVPKINDVFYYRKPPFYNWIMIAFFKVTGSMSEFVVRLPSVIPLFAFGATIYWWVKKHLNAKIAFFAAAMFVTCGRMLIYASMLGHIDIFYSWITFFSFIVIVECFKKEKWLMLFVVSYFLAGIGFLCKGLPTLIFQAFTLLAIFIAFKKFKKLISWEHTLGIVLFTLIVGGYFFIYSKYNALDGWVEQLWDQSAQRTVIDKAWYESLLHIVKFPLDHIYHLAPWSLLVIFIFKKGFRKEIWNNYFLKSITLIFLVNIPIYWLSPGYFPRYLFMLYPIFFIVMAYGFFTSTNQLKHNIVKYAFYVMGVALVAMPFALLFVELQVTSKIFKAAAVLVLAAIALVLAFKLKEHKYIAYVMMLLVFRIGFDWFVLPHRLANSRELEFKIEPIRVAKENNDLQIYDWTPVSHNATYYIERERKEVLSLKKGWQKGQNHIVGKHRFKENPELILVDSFSINYNQMELYVGRVP